MPQVFQVLKCYKCSVFQIHQTKKNNKFECKMCGEKQSIKRHYGIGTGKDCRLHVQKLNALRGNMNLIPKTESNSDEEYDDNGINDKISGNIENLETNPVKKSKWETFIEKEKVAEQTEEPMFMGDREVLLEIPQKRKTRKAQIKANESNSDNYLHTNSKHFKGPLKSDLRLNNNDDIDNLISEKNISDYNIPKNNTSTSSQEQSVRDNVHNLSIDNTSESAVVLETINKNSKWAQYVGIEDDRNLHGIVLSNHDSKECVSNSANLFSLCDDSDIDQLLDI